MYKFTISNTEKLKMVRLSDKPGPYFRGHKATYFADFAPSNCLPNRPPPARGATNGLVQDRGFLNDL